MKRIKNYILNKFFLFKNDDKTENEEIIKEIDGLSKKDLLYGKDLEKMEFLYSKDTKAFKRTFDKYLGIEKKNIWVNNDFYSVSNYILSMIDYLVHRDKSIRKMKVSPGDLVFANLHLAHKNEVSFIQPVLVLSVYGRNRIFVVPVSSNSGYRKEATHHTKKANGNKRYYLLTKSESGNNEEGAFVLDSSQMISISRVTSTEILSHIKPKSQTFIDIKEMVFQRTHPVEYKKIGDLEIEIKSLRNKISKLEK